MMHITKPFRIITYGVIIGAGFGLTYELFEFIQRGFGSRGAVVPALIAMPLFFFVSRFVVDSFDSRLRRDARDPNLVRQHEKKKDAESAFSVKRKAFAIIFSVLAILFSTLVANALFDHVNFAFQLNPPDAHVYGPDSDAYGSFIGTFFSYIAFVFALLSCRLNPRSKIGLIILVWCGLLLLGFMTLKPRF